ncbi:hypothetical protein OBBRIDRAFT_840459 [Obba rivulosa]|uniref:Uncharacterized protein n=1 Tax=Obba rivulosa TaxID=1052685 RepID=A0A8E2DEC6_9APHY|nr:hypothetical protein OBBRIDRAFT_840459 [Obba rivulosa]
MLDIFDTLIYTFLGWAFDLRSSYWKGEELARQRALRYAVERAYLQRTAAGGQETAQWYIVRALLLLGLPDPMLSNCNGVPPAASGLAASRTISQKIMHDTPSPTAYDPYHSLRRHLAIVSAMCFSLVTGLPAPASPVSANT